MITSGKERIAHGQLGGAGSTGGSGEPIPAGCVAGVDGHPDLVNEGDELARCGHSHHVLRTFDPLAFEPYALPAETLWTNTLTGASFVLLDDTPGAAVWAVPFTADHGLLAGRGDDDHAEYGRWFVTLTDPAASARSGDVWVESA